jgi:predicted Rossmann fold flavoprotein
LKNIAIIGAGASGLLCAIECAKNGNKVDIFEQNSKCAKKILVSGNGRCNITNTTATKDDYFGENPDFVTYALNNFPYLKFEKFANSIGLILELKENSKVYPLSNEAKSVASLLINYAKELDIKFHINTKITDIKQLLNKYDSVVIATGSQAASHLGGNSDGLTFAKVCGHNIIPTYPSLVQLHLAGTSYSKMSGTKIYGEITLLVNNKNTITTSGDILFTSYGVSGLATLDISQTASKSLMEYQAVDIVINLLPKFSPQKLSSYIIKSSQNIPNMTIVDILHGLLPIKIAKTILDECEISHDMKSSNIHTKLSKKITNKILNFKFEVTDTHGFRHAEVSGGGVDTFEVDSKTMQSLKQKKLYFCGEVLDVVGRRGGFNFAWAWASAKLAAQSITNHNKN